MPSLSLDLLEEVVAILPLSQEDLLYKGIATAITERIVELKRANQQFAKRYGSLKKLERKIETEGYRPTITPFMVIFWNGEPLAMSSRN